MIATSVNTTIPPMTSQPAMLPPEITQQPIQTVPQTYQQPSVAPISQQHIVASQQPAKSQTMPSSQGVPTTQQMVMNISQPIDMQAVYQQPVYAAHQMSTSVSVQNFSAQQSHGGFQHSMSVDDTLQNYAAVKKVPENLNQILERCDF